MSERNAFKRLEIAPRSSHSYRWWVLAAATLSQTTASFVMQGLAVLAAFLKDSLHLKGFQVGLLFTASSLPPIFTLLFIGNLLDLKSERFIISLGSLLMGVGLVLAYFRHNYLALLIALLIVGAGYSAIQPGGSRSVSGWFKPHQLGLAMGIRQAGLPLGGALAGVVLPYWLHGTAWNSVFALCLVVILFGALAFYAVYRSPVTEQAYPTPPALSVHRVLSLLKQPWMVQIVLFGFVLVAIQFGIVIYLLLYLHDVQGISLKAAAGILAMAQLFGGLGRIVLAALGDRGDKPTQRFAPIWFSFFSIALGLLVLVILPRGAPLILLQGLTFWLGFFALGWYGPWISHIAFVAPKGSLGLVLGLALTCNQIAIVSVPPILGMLLDMTGNYVSLWLTLLLAQIVTFVLYQFSLRFLNSNRPAAEGDTPKDSRGNDARATDACALQ